MITQKEKCPVCENKEKLSSMEFSPEELEELAENEHYADALDSISYQHRLEICRNCEDLQMGITCGQCGCFVQFRAKHSTAHCAMEKW